MVFGAFSVTSQIWEGYRRYENFSVDKHSKASKMEDLLIEKISVFRQYFRSFRVKKNVYFIGLFLLWLLQMTVLFDIMTLQGWLFYDLGQTQIVKPR